MERMLEAFHLHLRHRRRKAYVAYLQRRVEENGGDLSDEAMREWRKDWYLGSDGFRDQLVNQINEVAGKIIKKGSVSGYVVKAHKDADAEHVIQLLGAEIEYDVNRESLAPQRKGIWQKALLAAMVKKHCTMSNQWMAKRLEMGHHAGISKVVKLYQVCKEGIKQMKKYKKYLNPRTDPIYDPIYPFNEDGAYQSMGHWQGKIQITFPNADEGIIEVKDGFHSYSELTMPHQAPENGYQKDWSREEDNAGARLTSSEIGYFLRTRVKHDEKGKIVSANYSKIVTDFNFDPRGRLEFSYLFNPTPNDRNLEFDPKKNLFKNLEFREEIRKP